MTGVDSSARDRAIEQTWREDYRDVVSDIADSYVQYPNVRAEMINALLVGLDDVIAGHPEVVRALAGVATPEVTASPDTELAEAECLIRIYFSEPRQRELAETLMAEYDRRGAQRDAVLAVLDHDVHLIDAPALARVIRTALRVEMP